MWVSELIKKIRLNKEENITVINGNNEIITKEINLDKYKKINSFGSINLLVIPSSESKIEIECESNIIDKVKTEIKNDVLTIRIDGCISTKREIKAIVYTDNLSSVKLNGSGNATLVDFSGESLDVTLLGSGSVKAVGEAYALSLNLCGSGSMHLDQLKASRVNATLAGSGCIKTHCEKDMYASLTGSGDIIVYGNPEAFTKNKKGSGSIRSI